MQLPTIMADSQIFFRLNKIKYRTIVSALLLNLTVSLVWASNEKIDTQPIADANNVSFVQSQSCADCHPQKFKEWLGSHHEQAMQPAFEKTVLGDFDNASFETFGITSRFFKKAGKFFVNTEGADGKLADFEVKYTFGITPIQQYLLALPNGQLQAFTIAWDTVNQRWFNLQPDEKIGHHDPLHWTRRHYTWNSSCAECHSTDLRLNYDLKTNSYQTTWAEINVSCEACHGPGGEHVKWANWLKNEAKVQDSQDQKNKGLIINYNTLDAKGKIETCAPCHSRRYPISQPDKPGQPFLDHFMPSLLQEGLYHADGQILDEVYVYGSFLQTKMYQQGVNCMDCHNPHTLKLRRAGNQLCTFCHQPTPPKSLFNTLAAKNYDAPSHHFHKMDSPGANCVNCHAPAKNYMVIDPRHDHSFPIPRPDLSVKLGTPNACTQCHQEQSAQWAIEKMTQWYGQKWQQKPHFAETIAAGRAGQRTAQKELLQLVQDSNQPAIIRATALDLLRIYPNHSKAMIGALADKEPLIRTVAVQGLENLPVPQKLEKLIPLLKDPVRAVRIEAGKVLASVPLEKLEPSQQVELKAVLQEYQQAQMAQADQPEGYLNMGGLYTAMGQPKLAERAYKIAIQRDKLFFQAYNNLANLYYQQDRKKEAEQMFRQAIKTTTDQGILYYSLGLLLAEQKRIKEALDNFAKAAELMPNHPRVHYNYGLLLQRLRQFSKAETALLKAWQLNATDPNILHALAIFYIQIRQWKRASTYAERFAQLYPNTKEAQQLLDYIQKKIRK
jgi:tetratricopeptide (TPR) repeat protein